MIYFIFGQDSYRSREKLNEIVKEHKGFDVKSVDLSLTNLTNEFRQHSMFGEKKLLILTDFFKNQSFKDEFIENIDEFKKSDDVIVFYEDKKPDKRDSLFKALIKKSDCHEFKPIEGLKLKNWVNEQFSNYNVKISSIALDKLISFVGNDLWRMGNEVKKLSSFKNEIDEKDVDLLVRSNIESDIFKTIDAIADKNKKKALSLLHNHIEKGDAPLYLFSMINYQFRNLLSVKDLIEKGIDYSSIIKRTKLHPFVVKKSSYQAQKFSLLELKRIYQKIFQIDLDIKTGRVDQKSALDLFISEA